MVRKVNDLMMRTVRKQSVNGRSVLVSASSKSPLFAHTSFKVAISSDRCVERDWADATLSLSCFFHAHLRPFLPHFTSVSESCCYN